MVLNKMNKNKLKIFFSYAHLDLGVANKIYNDQKRYGLDSLLENELLSSRQDWKREISYEDF